MNPVDILVRVLGSAQASAQMGAIAGVTQELTRRALDAARAVAELVSGAISEADELGKLAQKVGIAVEELSALAYAGKLADADLGTLQTSLRGLSDWMVKTGQQGRPTIEVLLEMADQFAAMPEGAEKTAKAMDIFGRSGLEMIPLLNAGSAGIRNLMSEAQSLGLVISGTTAAGAETFNDRLTTMRAQVQGAALVLADRLLPNLLRLSDVFVALLREGTPFLDLLKESAGIMSIVAGVTQWMVEKWTLATTAMGSLWGQLAMGIPLEEAMGEALREAGEAQEALRSSIAAARAERERSSEADEHAIKTNAVLGESTDELKKKLEGTEQLLKARRDRIAEERAILDATFTVSEFDKRAPRLALLEREIELIDITAMSLRKLQEAEADPAKAAAIQDRLFSLEDQQRQLMAQRAGLGATADPFSANDQMIAGLNRLRDEWGTTAQQIAGTITGTIGTAVDSITAGITGLIMRTQTWAQALQQIGTSILNQVISSIVRMFVTWVVNMTIMKALSKLFQTETNAQAVGAAAAWAPAAVAASIASYGTAAAIGLSSYLGSVVAGTAVTSGMAAAAFADGGLTPSRPTLAWVGERGTELVLPAEATASFTPVQQAMLMEGKLPVVPGAESSRPGRPTEQRHYHYWDREEFLAASRDDIEGIVHDVLRRA